MNRTELVDAVSTDTGLSRQQAEAALQAIIYEVTAGVRSGNPVRITGFGTFKLRERKARRGRNPQTGAPVKVKASKGIGFTPGTTLKTDLNSRGALAKPKLAPVPRAAAATATKTTATKATATKAPAKRATATKAAATKTAATKTTARKVTATKVTKAPVKKATATKATKTTAKKAPAKRVAKRA